MKLNDTILFLIGGTTDDDSASGLTYAYDNVDNSWSKGPTLTEPRSGHACGVLRTETDHYIVVAGGSTGSNYAQTVEMLKISQGGEIAESWTTGPALPRNVLFGSMVEYRLVSDQDIFEYLGCFGYLVFNWAIPGLFLRYLFSSFEQLTGQWLWHSWQSGCFRYQRTRVRIQSTATFIEHLFTVNCL